MWSLLVVPCALLMGVARVLAVDVTQCGRVLDPGEVGELRADLRCTRGKGSPVSGSGVRLTPGATLRLNGFSIHGDGRGTGVECHPARRNAKPCRVEGPGMIEGFELGIGGVGCRLEVRGVTVSGNTQGILAAKACRLKAIDVVVSDNVEHGIWATHVRGTRIDASRNGGRGLMASFRLRVNDVRATDNGLEGVSILAFRRARGRIVESIVVGNDRLGRGVDVSAAGRVRLIRTICGRSARLRYLRPPHRNGYHPRVVGSFGCEKDQGSSRLISGARP